MRICYVARHGCGGNQDENAITYALEQLGHEVICLHEDRVPKPLAEFKSCDFILFHKWADTETMRKVPVPLVFWYFDLVRYDDNSLHRRNVHRINWMSQITPLVKVGFLSDGDWVEASRSSKLIHLPQGADERYVGVAEPKESIQILFTGITNGGVERERFVKMMRAAYGSQFVQVERGVHQEELRQLIANAQIVVAPSGPVSDKYWSNRVYLTLGFGGFLLHPKCEGVQVHFGDKQAIVFYDSIQHLYELISYYRDRPEERERIARNGYELVNAYHLYRHRCERLIEVVKERIGYHG